MVSVTLGLDVGGTRIKGVALNASLQILESFEGPSDASEGPDAVRKALHTTVTHFRNKGFEPSAIGVGCAGSVNSEGGLVRNSPNFSHFENVPLGPWLRNDFGVPTFVDNDANCAVLAEWKLGNAIGDRNVVLLTIGTGIGGGLILNSRLFRGSTGTGGEIGHMSIYADGKSCPCRNRGCFERYCSASALRDMVKGQYSAREIFSRGSEEFFHRIIQTFLTDFQIGLTSIANVFDPDSILLGGAVSTGIAQYFDQIEKWIKEHAFPAVASHMRLGVAKHGNFSGAIGAALLSHHANE